MDDLISAAEAAVRLDVTKDWIVKLCAAGRIPGARKIGNQWVIPPGAKIEPTGLGRPLRTLEIPRSQPPIKAFEGRHSGAGPREGKGEGLVRAPAEGRRGPKGRR